MSCFARAILQVCCLLVLGFGPVGAAEWLDGVTAYDEAPVSIGKPFSADVSWQYVPPRYSWGEYPFATYPTSDGTDYEDRHDDAWVDRYRALGGGATNHYQWVPSINYDCSSWALGSALFMGDYAIGMCYGIPRLVVEGTNDINRSIIHPYDNDMAFVVDWVFSDGYLAHGNPVPFDPHLWASLNFDYNHDESVHTINYIDTRDYGPTNSPYFRYAGMGRWTLDVHNDTAGMWDYLRGYINSLPFVTFLPRLALVHYFPSSFRSGDFGYYGASTNTSSSWFAGAKRKGYTFVGVRADAARRYRFTRYCCWPYYQGNGEQDVTAWMVCEYVPVGLAWAWGGYLYRACLPDESEASIRAMTRYPYCGGYYNNGYRIISFDSEEATDPDLPPNAGADGTLPFGPVVPPGGNLPPLNMPAPANGGGGGGGNGGGVISTSPANGGGGATINGNVGPDAFDRAGAGDYVAPAQAEAGGAYAGMDTVGFDEAGKADTSYPLSTPEAVQASYANLEYPDYSAGLENDVRSMYNLTADDFTWFYREANATEVFYDIASGDAPLPIRDRLLGYEVDMASQVVASDTYKPNPTQRDSLVRDSWSIFRSAEIADWIGSTPVLVLPWFEIVPDADTGFPSFRRTTLEFDPTEDTDIDYALIRRILTWVFVSGISIGAYLYIQRVMYK